MQQIGKVQMVSVCGSSTCLWRITYKDKNLEKAILEACAKGIIVVVASGNEGDGDGETFEYRISCLDQ